MAERDETRQEQTSAPSDGSSTETTTATGGNGDLEAQLKAATEEAAQYKDRFLRERAEMENFKKRQERLAGERMQRYKRDLLEKVIEVMDNLDRAMQYESSMDQESLNQGLRMVHWQLEEILKTEGLTPVATVGQVFDPHVHEAIESVASPEHPEGTVVEEVRKGYMLGGDMVRPARVKVSSGA
ncbi:MAG TPA: nucleotide exchange factor GrpE [Ktedonobacterales bacterium]|nr:nucleotide exchange factor GrpE [Ktedonobacterales bacterium]